MATSKKTSTFSYFQKDYHFSNRFSIKTLSVDNSLDTEETPANDDLNIINSTVSPTEKVPRKKYTFYPADEHIADIIEKSLN